MEFDVNMATTFLQVFSEFWIFLFLMKHCNLLEATFTFLKHLSVRFLIPTTF